jgi:hypothetical protein
LLLFNSNLDRLGIFFPSIVGADSGGGGDEMDRSRIFNLGLPPASLASASCFSIDEIDGSCCIGAILFSLNVFELKQVGLRYRDEEFDGEFFLAQLSFFN